jgi:hypothetical protein
MPSTVLKTAPRAQSPFLAKTVVVAQAQSSPKVCVINKISRAEESHLVPANAAAITNTVEATIVTLEIKKLEDLLEQGGVGKGAVRRMRDEIEVLKGMLGRMDREKE